MMKARCIWIQTANATSLPRARAVLVTRAARQTITTATEK